MRTKPTYPYHTDPIANQARAAARHYVHRGIKTIALFPRSKSSDAVPNRFQAALFEQIAKLEKIPPPSPRWRYFTKRQRLEEIQTALEAFGYRFPTVDPAEYTPKLYRAQIESGLTI